MPGKIQKLLWESWVQGNEAITSNNIKYTELLNGDPLIRKASNSNLVILSYH
jgi:hypothetical protein